MNVRETVDSKMMTEMKFSVLAHSSCCKSLKFISFSVVLSHGGRQSPGTGRPLLKSNDRALCDGHEIINAATLHTQSNVAVALELTHYGTAVDATEYSL